MRKVFLLIILILVYCSLSAQDGLKSAPAFDGRLIPQEGRTETLVKGSQLDRLELSLFHSVKSVISAQTLDEIASLVQEDAKDAVSKEMDIVHGRLSYALISFQRSEAGKGRYLCFQSQEAEDGRFEVILVYMEGSTTIDNLKRKFSK